MKVTGKCADFAVLDQDMMPIPAGDNILKTSVVAADVDGNAVYERK